MDDRRRNHGHDDQSIFGFWQASQEVEDIRAVQERQPLTRKPGQAPDAFKRIRVDTWLDMAFWNLVAVTIMITTATTLHRTASLLAGSRQR
jgi:Mn2+/Fe2+ NRAMP family transporter